MRKKNTLLCPQMVPFVGLVIFIGCLLVCSSAAYANDTKTLSILIESEEQLSTYRILDHALKRLGYNSTYDTMGMISALENVNTGEKDGISSQIEGYEDDYPNLVMIPTSYIHFNYYVYALKSNTLQINTWEDLSGYKVGSYYQRNYIVKKLPADIEVHVFKKTWEELVTAVKTGECDLIIISFPSSTEPRIDNDLAICGMIDSIPAYTYLNRAYAELAADLDIMFQQMIKDGSISKFQQHQPTDRSRVNNILLITSNSSELRREQDLVDGMRAALEEQKKDFHITGDVVFNNFSLNSARITDVESREAYALKSIRSTLLTTDVRIVIAAGNAALSFVQNYYSTLFVGIPIVFTSVCDFNEELLNGIPTDQVTGVVETIQAYDTVELMLSLFPKTELIYVVNDHTPLGQVWKSNIAKQVAPFEDRVQFVYNDSISSDELLQDIASLPENALVLTGVYMTDANGMYFSQPIINAQINEVSSVPIFGLFHSSLGYGQIGGKYDTGWTSGTQAIDISLKILSGEPISEIPLRLSYEGSHVWSFDNDYLVKWGIKKNQLPANAEIINMNIPFYQSNPTMASVFTAMVLIAMLMAGFTFSLRRKNHNIHAQMQRLDKAQHDMQTALNLLPIPTTILEPISAEILFLNDACVSFFAVESKNSLLGNKTGLFNNDADSYFTTELLRSHFVKASHTRNSSSWYWEYYVQESVKKVICFTNQINYNDKNCLVLAIKDISAEEQQKALLKIAAEKEKDANTLKSRFLMNMSHEIRTPMNAIIGLSELALLRDQSPENFNSIKKINVSAKNLLQIINDILDFSKIEAEKLDLIETVYHVEEVIANALLIAVEKIEDKPIELNVDIAPDVPYNIIGDKTRVWQILKNLLDNAAKYTQKGHITLAVSTKEDQLVFQVKDSGMGMDKDQLDILGTPFEQFHAEGKTLGAGTGLGMSITKQLVSLMHGTFSVKSRIQVGSTFTITLPLRLAKNCATMGELLDIQLPSHYEVLLFHTDSVTLRIAEKLISLMGCHCVFANTMEEVKRLCRDRSENPFYAIIVYDGIRTGFYTTEDIQFIASQEQSRLILVSSHGSQFPESHAFAIIEKPFVPTVLARHLSSTNYHKKTIAQNAYQQFPHLRVLLCEDNEINQEVAVGVLSIFGITPTIAGDGKQGLACLDNQPFDLILMDLMMPVMDGHEAAIAIRNSKKSYSQVPIIAMTAHVMNEEIERCKRSGMNAHIGKPLQIDAVYEKIVEFVPEKMAVLQ